jgi:hypothetical protein
VAHYFAPFLAGWALTLTLLIIAHLLWDRAPEEVRYALGVGAICLGCALTGLILDQPLLAFGPAVIASAGLVIVAIQHFERLADDKQRSAQKNGEIVGMAKGLARDLSEGHDAQSGMDEARRRN